MTASFVLRMVRAMRFVCSHCLFLILALLLAACSSTPSRAPGGVEAPTARSGPAPASERDGPGSDAPPNLAAVPDAQPQIEPIRTGGPNKPYEVAGKSYVPLTGDVTHVERGLASWYGRKFHGRRTAMGEVYNMYAMTAAHPTLPLPSYVRVRNPANNKEVVLRVNDRGPFHPGRIIDLSYTAALKLDLLRGVGPVEIERITFDAIRSGAWRDGTSRPATNTNETPPPAPVPVASTPDPAVSPTQARPVTHNSAVAQQPAPSATTGFFVQIAAFKQLDGAHAFHRQVVADLSWLAPLLAVFSDTSVHRLQAGPYSTRDEALGIAQQVREALKLVPVVVQR